MKINALPPRVASQVASSDIHVFAFEGRRYAYFIASADLLEIRSKASFHGLSWIRDGHSLEEAKLEVLRSHGPEDAAAACADLDLLDGLDLLSRKDHSTAETTAAEIQGYLRHKPRNIMFFVTEACNLQCSYCYEKNQGVHSQPATMARVNAIKVLDAVFSGSGRSACTVTFFGGEPLLNFQVVRAATLYARELAERNNTLVEFTITTNLTLLTEEIARFLAQQHFRVMVSLDGDRDNNDRHRTFRDGSGTYDLVVSNLAVLARELRAAGARPAKIRATMTAENHDVLAIEKHLRTLGTPLVEIGVTHGTVASGKSDYDVGSDKKHADDLRRRHLVIVREAIRRLELDPACTPELPASVVKSLRRVHKEIQRREPHTITRPKLCGVCRNMRAVTPSGDLYPCHRYVGMPAFRMGNIHEGGMNREREALYYSEIHRAFRDKCTDCWARFLCGGQCPWYLSDDSGAISAPDDDTCDEIRLSFEAHLGFYALLLQRHSAFFQRVIGVSADEVVGNSAATTPDDVCK